MTTAAQMDIFDCFCGIGPWQTRDRLLPYRPTEILALLDHFGIGTALVHSNFAADGGSPLRGNLIVREACSAQARFIPAFNYPPYPYDDSPGVEGTLAAMRAAGAKVLWHEPRKGVGIERWLWGAMLEACSERGVPLFVHREGIAPDAIHALLTDFPALNVVLVAVGYGDDWWLYPLLKKFARLRVSLGHYYIPADNPARFVRHFSADRLLFGSGLPHFSPGGLIAHVMYADLRDAERASIFGGNLRRLLGEARL
jgi:predicted TIM-barrel fold metal-dependent hydrolase